MEALAVLTFFVNTFNGINIFLFISPIKYGCVNRKQQSRHHMTPGLKKIRLKRLFLSLSKDGSRACRRMVLEPAEGSELWCALVAAVIGV